MVFDDRAPNVFAAVTTLAIFSFIFFPLRLYVRVSKRAWGYDDWSMAVGFVPFLALTIACIGGTFNGVGMHQGKLNEYHQTQGRLWFFLFQILFCVAIIFIKLSISFMLARIASPKRAYVYALWIVSAVVTIMNLVSLLYIIFQCDPVSYAWDYSIEGGSCLPSQGLANMYYADTAANIFGDWFCAVLPVPLLWDIQMNRNSKLASGALLSLGVLASLSACIRLKYTVNLNNSDDFLYSVGDIVIWGYAENAVGLIVGCISTLRPLFRSVLHLGSDSTGRNKNSIPLKSSHKHSGMTGEFDLPRPDKARATATVMGRPLKKPSNPSLSGSEEELVRDIGNGIQVSKTVMQHRDDDVI